MAGHCGVGGQEQAVLSPSEATELGTASSREDAVCRLRTAGLN